MTSHKKLEALKAEIDRWKVETDEISDRRFGSLNEQEEAALGFVLQLNRAEMLIVDLKAIAGEKALIARRSFEFLVNNVRSTGRAPREVLTMCRELMAA